MITNVFTTNRLKWNAEKFARESLGSKLASINSAAEEEAVPLYVHQTGGCGSFCRDILISKDLGCGLMDLALFMLSGTIKILTIPAERMIVHTSCPLRGEEIKRIQFGEILAQRIMGYLGQVTEAFGHFLYMSTSRYLDQQTLSFKMIPRTACHPLGAANLKN